MMSSFPAISGKNAVLPGRKFREFGDVFAAKRYCYHLSFHGSFDYLQVRYWVQHYFCFLEYDFRLENLSSYSFSKLFTEDIAALLCDNLSSCYVMHCNPRSMRDIGVVVCYENEGSWLFDNTTDVIHLYQGVWHSCGGIIVRGFFCR